MATRRAPSPSRPLKRNGGAQAQRLRAVIAALRARYGPSIIRTGAEVLALPAAVSPHGRPRSTGSLGLDLIAAGLPRGGIAEYAGVDGSGKEALAFAALAACQRAHGTVLLVDADGAVDPDALCAAGVDLDRLVLACPTAAVEAWHILVSLARADALDLVVLLSLSGLLALPGDEGHMTGGTRLARGLARLTMALQGSATTALLVNQPLPSRPSPPHPLHGSPLVDGTLPFLSWRGSGDSRGDDPSSVAWTTHGGGAMAQAARLRVALRPAGFRLAAWGDIAGMRATAVVIKHRGMAHAECVALEFGPDGLRRAAELVALGLRTGLLRETTLGLALDDHILGRNMDRAAAMLEAHPAVAMELERRVRTAWRASSVPHVGIRDGGH